MRRRAATHACKSRSDAPMLTDWLLVRRAAQELRARLRGAKVRDVGQLSDGRIAIALWSRGQTQLLCIDTFAPTPLLTIEEGELPIASEPGFVRAAGAALRGTTLADARARTGDRILRLDFAARSRFGVRADSALICELVPRFGNVILLKDRTIVAAAKEFSRAENPVRAVEAGRSYEPPPLNPERRVPKILRDGYAGTDAEDLVRTLNDDQAPPAALYVYRRDGVLVQAHLVPLPQYAELDCGRTDGLLEIFAEARTQNVGNVSHDRAAKRRRDMEKALAERERKAGAELTQIDARLHDALERDLLRERGEAVYETLHALPPDEQAAAKERATELFEAYKKLGAARVHLQARRTQLERLQAAIEDLRWEVERAEPDALTDVAEVIAALDRRARVAERPAARKRKPLQYVTDSGSRILVGRTPIENADLTFRVARPNDLWFHARATPGAHVIIQRDDRREPPECDLLAAASLAALHSKAGKNAKAAVDYTPRKFVRKQPAAPPGLVFYVNARTLYVAPANFERPPSSPQGGIRTPPS